MAAGGFKEFVAGEVLDEDEINDFLMQGVLVFAGTAARGSAITSPVEGQFSFLKDSDSVEFHDGSDWVPLSSGPGAAVISGTTGSPTLGTVTTGGTTYNVYSFTGDGSITFSEAGFAEMLVIAGGGAGGKSLAGQYDGGGGGAGGYLQISSGYVPAGTATVVVGAGGAFRNVGRPSRLGLYYAVGGGHGADLTVSAMVGGSGGGGRDVGNGAVGTSGQGFAGGNSSGGGGGAAEAGSTDGAKAGGDGLASSITGTSVTRAGGGGGATNGIAGDGGGGAAGAAGTANTGGGGGAGINTDGLAGGSGIVIVRVAV